MLLRFILWKVLMWPPFAVACDCVSRAWELAWDCVSSWEQCCSRDQVSGPVSRWKECAWCWCGEWGDCQAELAGSQGIPVYNLPDDILPEINPRFAANTNRKAGIPWWTQSPYVFTSGLCTLLWERGVGGACVLATPSPKELLQPHKFGLAGVSHFRMSKCPFLTPPFCLDPQKPIMAHLKVFYKEDNV